MSSEGQNEQRPGISTSTRWVLLGTVVTKPLQLATSVVLARILGPASFGYLNIANVTAMTLGGIAGFGLGEAANRFIAENFRRDRTTAIGFAALIIWTSFAIGVAIFGAAWLLRDFWAIRVFHGAASEEVVALCLLLGLLNLLFSLSVNIFTGLQTFRDLTVLSVLQASSAIALALPLAHFHAVPGALLGSVLASITCVIWAALRVRRIEPALLLPPKSLPQSHAKEIVNFSLPSWLAGLIANPVLLFTFSYLAAQPGGASELGQFNTANALKMLVAMLPGLVGSAIGPGIVEEAGRHGNPDAYAALLENSLFALAFLTLPLTVALLFLSDVIFLVYGTAYSEAYRLFMPLAAGIAVGVLSTPFQFAMVARSRTWWLLAFAIAKSMMLLLAALWWVPTSLSTGLAWTFFAAEVTYAVLVTEFCVRNDLVPRKAWRLFYAFAVIPIALLALALTLSPSWRWLMAIPLGALAAVAIVRAHPPVAIWIEGVLPSVTRPRAQRILRMISGAGSP